jgi:circadian clock protein KaiB
MKVKEKRVAKRRRSAEKKAPTWELHLYVADTTARSILATGNLQRLCEQYLKGNYRVTVIDIVKAPESAREHQILATPTLVRVLPGPEKTVIGCLSDTERVLQALQIANPEQLISQVASLPVGHA